MTEIFSPRHGSFSWVRQPAYTSGLRPATPPSFEATSDGAAGGTTIVSTTLGGATAAAWVGYIVECVRAVNRANRGCLAMVKAFASGSNTLTIDKLPAQVKATDRFRLYTTPDAPAVVTTATLVGAGTLIAAGRDEVDDAWNGTAEEGGCYVEVVKAAAAAKTDHPLITDWTRTTHTANISPVLSGAPAVGDFMRFMKHPKIDGVSIIPLDRPDIPQDTLAAGYGVEPPAAGRRGAAGAVTLLGRGPGRTRAGLAAEADEALQCTLTPTAARSGIVVDSGSAVGKVEITSADPAVGEMYATAEGDVFMVTAVVPSDYMTPSPPLRNAPAAAQTLTGVRVYSPADLLRYALTCYQWRGNAIEEILYGVVPLPSFSAEVGGYHRLTFQLQAADYYQAALAEDGNARERLWYPRNPTEDSLRGRDMRLAIYDGSSCVELPMSAYSFTPGIEVYEQLNGCAPNETDGRQITQVIGKGTFKTRINSTTRRLLRDFEAKRELLLHIQVGAAPGHGGMAGIYCPAVTLDSVPLDGGSGEYEATVPFTCVRDETARGLGLKQFHFWSC